LENFIEEELSRHSIFKDEAKLNLEYIPEKLLHREKEFLTLSRYFKILLLRPNAISPRILITGKNGIGKTSLTKRFGNLFVQRAKKMYVKLEYVHINCRIEKNAYQIILKVLKRIKIPISERGFSFYELLKLLINEIEIRDLGLILTLDEIDYLKKNDYKLIYDLLKFNDDKINPKQRISIIAIANSSKIIEKFDNNLKSIFLPHKIKFRPYSNQEIFDILKERANEAFYIGTVSDQIIKQISKVCTPSGDIRVALDLLRKVGKVAEKNRSFKITQDFLNDVLEDYKSSYL